MSKNDPTWEQATLAQFHYTRRRPNIVGAVFLSILGMLIWLAPWLALVR